MAERSLVPFGQSGEFKAPVLSPKQDKDLIELSRMYAARTLGLSPTIDILTKVGAVASDAIFRALGEQGRTSLTGKDRLKPLFGRGVEIREDLRQKAKGFLELSLKNQNTYFELVGPLAIPTSMLKTVNTDAVTFGLTADLGAEQQLIEMGEQRLALVDPWTKIGLSSLPEQFGSVALDRFPQIPERVRLIRNMIASFVFRGSLSPAIPIAELREFVGRGPSQFSQEAREILIEEMKLETPVERSYLEALFTQTAAPFNLYTVIPPDDNPKRIDDFYRRYANDLLLLHPALEEQQIVIIPERVGADSLSLWSNGALIKNIRLPKPEMIARAIRQSRAKRDELNTHRLYEGLKVWQWFEHQKQAHKDRVQRGADQLWSRQLLLYNLDDPYFPLPKEAYFIVFKTQSEARATLTTRRREVEGIKRAISEHHNLQRRTQEYADWLDEQFGAKWPEQVPKPREVLLQELQNQENKLHGQNSAITGRLSKIEDFLHLDLLWSEASGLYFGFLQRKEAGEWVEEQLKTPPQGKSPAELNISDSELFTHLNAYFWTKPKPDFLPAELRSYFKFWEGVYNNLKRNPLARDNRQFLQNLMPQMLAQRKNLLQFTGVTLQKRAQIQKEEQKLREQIKEYTTDPQKPLPQDQAYWSRTSARNYILEIGMVTLPEIKEEDIESLIKTARETRGLLMTLPQTDLPKHIFSIGNLASFIEAKIERLAERVAAKKASNDRKGLIRLEYRLDQFKRLMPLLDTPIVPKLDREGLPLYQFIRVWRKRAELFYKVYTQEEAEEEETKAEENYQEITREVFRTRLETEVINRRKALERLKRRDIEQELVGRMRALNLVLE